MSAYVVQAWNGKRWAKVRGFEGGPWHHPARAERVASARQMDTERPHRVVALKSAEPGRSSTGNLDRDATNGIAASAPFDALCEKYPRGNGATA